MAVVAERLFWGKMDPITLDSIIYKSIEVGRLRTLSTKKAKDQAIKLHLELQAMAKENEFYYDEEIRRRNELLDLRKEVGEKWRWDIERKK